MTNYAVTNTDFVASTAIASSEMDANFDSIETFLNTTGVHVFQSGVVTDSAMGTGAKQYRDISVQTCLRTAIGSTANFAAPMGVAATLLSAAGASSAIVYIDPADYALTGKTTYARLQTWSQTETAPISSTTLTTALYPVSSTAAGVITVGTVVTGSSSTTGAITAANTRTLTTTADFAFPTAGYYVVVFTHSVNPAQTLTYGWKLQARAQ